MDLMSVPKRLLTDLTPSELEEEKFVIENKKKALAELLEKECVGKYKIELMFSHKRSQLEPVAGVLCAWESGTKLHGGGDAKVYFCPGTDLGVNTCTAAIPFDNCNYGHLLCPRCGKVWKSAEVHGEIFARLSLQAWAEKLVRYYSDLGHNADLYLKLPRADIRKAAESEQQKQMGGERLGAVRSGLVRVIYPLARIIRDTNNGCDLYTRFYAFLKS